MRRQPMIVSARYLHEIYGITGKDEESIKLKQGATVEDLIEELVFKYGKKLERFIFEAGTRKIRYGKILIAVQREEIVGSQRIEGMDGTKTKLYPQDKVLFFQPVAGG